MSANPDPSSLHERGTAISTETPNPAVPSTPWGRGKVWASALLPVLLLGGMIALFFAKGTGIDRPAPAPLETLDFSRIEFQHGEIVAHVVNSGPEPVTIAQVQIGW